MRSHLALTMWFLLALQASIITCEDKCSSTTYNYSSDSNSLNLLIKDINTTQRDCFCEATTDPSTVACSLYACLQCGSIDPSDIICSLLPCPCAKIVNVTISPTCISTYTTSINCLQEVIGYEARSCHSSTKSLLSFSTKPAISCSMEVKSKDLVFTIQHITIDGDDDITEQALKEGNCTAKPAKPNTSSTSRTPVASNSATKAAIKEHISMVESTPTPETAGLPSPTLVSGSMFMSMATEPLQNLRMMTYESGKNIGIGVGVGGGVLLIIAIIIVILIFRKLLSRKNLMTRNDKIKSRMLARSESSLELEKELFAVKPSFDLRRRRSESNNFRAENYNRPTTQSTEAPSETACESHTVLVSAAFDNAINDAMPSYQTITYDNEPVGESNDGYTDVEKSEETSNHDG